MAGLLDSQPDDQYGAPISDSDLLVLLNNATQGTQAAGQGPTEPIKVGDTGQSQTPSTGQEPGFWDKIGSGLADLPNLLGKGIGSFGSSGVTLPPEQERAANIRALGAFGMQLLANSGPSPVKHRLGEGLAAGLAAGAQARSQTESGAVSLAQKQFEDRLKVAALGLTERGVRVKEDELALTREKMKSLGNAAQLFRLFLSGGDPNSGQGGGQGGQAPAVKWGEALPPPNADRTKIAFADPVYEKAVDAAVAAEGGPAPPSFVKSIVMQESNGNPNAPISDGGRSVGGFQIGKEEASGVGIADRTTPEGNISAGVRYINYLWRKYDGDAAKVALAYNAGPGGVDAVLAGSRFPGGSAQYVSNVLTMSGLPYSARPAAAPAGGKPAATAGAPAPRADAGGGDDGSGGGPALASAWPGLPAGSNFTVGASDAAPAGDAGGPPAGGDSGGAPAPAPVGAPGGPDLGFGPSGSWYRRSVPGQAPAAPSAAQPGIPALLNMLEPQDKAAFAARIAMAAASDNPATMEGVIKDLMATVEARRGSRLQDVPYAEMEKNFPGAADPTAIYQRDLNGKIYVTQSGRPPVPYDQTESYAQAKTRQDYAKAQLTGYGNAGAAGKNMLDTVTELQTLNSALGAGNVALEKYPDLANFLVQMKLVPEGTSTKIAVANAWQSAVNRMAQDLHKAGTGSQSDKEFSAQMRALPQVGDSEESRTLQLAFLRSWGNRRQQEADLAQQYYHEHGHMGGANKWIQDQLGPAVPTAPRRGAGATAMQSFLDKIPPGTVFIIPDMLDARTNKVGPHLTVRSMDNGG